MKWQPTGWEQIFSKHKSDKSLVFQIILKFLQFKNQRQINPIQKWAKDWNRHFPREEIQMINKHRKRCLTTTSIRKMQIKTKWDITSWAKMTPIKWNKAKMENYKFGEDMRNWNLCVRLVRMLNSKDAVEKSDGSSKCYI